MNESNKNGKIDKSYIFGLSSVRTPQTDKNCSNQNRLLFHDNKKTIILPFLDSSS